MRKIVADSSVIVKWVSKDSEEHLKQSDKILNDLRTNKVAISTPELARYEVGNALLKKGLESHQAFHSLGTVYGLPIQFIQETESLASETYQMASDARSLGATKFTYYDAAFTALAKQQKATLVTDNPKHQAKIKGVKVVALKDYQ